MSKAIDKETKKKMLSLFKVSFDQLKKETPLDIKSLQCSYRPELGASISLDMYRYVRVYALRNILGSYFSALVLYESGKNLANQFDFSTVDEVAELFAKLKIGFVKVVEASINKWIFEEDECAACSGLPLMNETMCHFEAGIISGALEKLFNQPVSVTETKCWGLGDQICRFEAVLAGEEYEQQERLESLDTNQLVSIMAAKAVGAIDLAQKLAEQKKVLEEENHLASQVIQALLPAKKEALDIRFDYLYYPSYDLGGDFIDVIQLDSGKHLIFLSDVSGHGPRAAIFTAAIKSSLERLARKYENPAKIILKLNEDMCNLVERTDLNIFVACFIGIIDKSAGQLRYCTAGFPSPVIIGNNSNPDEKLSGRGPALGLIKNKIYPEQVTPIKKGDRLVFFTDGIIELRSNKKRLDMEKLFKRLARYRSKTPEQIIELIKSRIIEVVGDKKAGDDITLLVVDII